MLLPLRGALSRGRALPVGFATGALTGFYGVGGGFLIVPALAVLLGVGFAEAIATSPAVIALTSAAALVAHLASGGVNWHVTASFTAAGVIGALAGTGASELLQDARLKSFACQVDRRLRPFDHERAPAIHPLACVMRGAQAAL